MSQPRGSKFLKRAPAPCGDEKSGLGSQLASNGDAKMELFDCVEVFYNRRRRHATLVQVSPVVYERPSQATYLNRPPNRIKRRPESTPMEGRGLIIRSCGR